MKEIFSKNAPSAIGPYSQAIEKDGFIFISGQLPLEADTSLMQEGIASQTKQVLKNIEYILKEVNLQMKNIVKTTILLKNIDDFEIVNNIYSQYFTSPFPARTTYEVSKLPKGALIEIETIAKK